MIEPDAIRPKSVLAAGLSPAWQQIMVFDAFRVGEVNRASDVRWCASGKVLNVGIALAHLSRNRAQSPTGVGAYRHSGAVCRTLSVIGARARESIEREFAALGVDCRWIDTAAETRICTTILDRATGRTTELVENAAALTDAELTEFRGAFAEEAATAEVIVLTGSLPPNVPTTLWRELLGTTTARVVLDIRGPELLAALDCRPFCVKPNREELAKTLGHDLRTDEELHAAMRELNRRGAEWVVITQGAGPVWVSNGNDRYRFEPPAVEHVVNPIGSGDCLAAGIAWATASGRPMLDAVRFGIAAAADNVSEVLPARLELSRIATWEGRIECRAS